MKREHDDVLQLAHDFCGDKYIVPDIPVARGVSAACFQVPKIERKYHSDLADMYENMLIHDQLALEAERAKYPQKVYELPETSEELIKKVPHRK